MDTLASKISQITLEKLVDSQGLTEVAGADRGPAKELVAPAFGNVEVGSFREWTGDGAVTRVVYTGISVDAIGLDSHMLFAFTDHGSLVPTFTLDSVFTNMPPGADANFPDGGAMYSFHLDLVPRCDLGINYAYSQRVYEPLTESRAKVLDSDGVFEAALTPMQRSIMSPWMLAQRVTPSAYENEVFPAVDHYLSHWLGLVASGVDSHDVNGDWGAERDALNRALIFNRDIDAVWAKIDGLLGPDVSEAMIASLRRG